MDTEKIQQLKDDFTQEMSELFKNSNFGKLLEKYGLSGEHVLKFEAMIDITNIPSSDAENEQVKDSSRAILEQQFVTLGCFWCPCCGCCG